MKTLKPHVTFPPNDQAQRPRLPSASLFPGKPYAAAAVRCSASLGGNPAGKHKPNSKAAWIDHLLLGHSQSFRRPMKSLNGVPSYPSSNGGT
jgi:hypothetical protein